MRPILILLLLASVGCQRGEPGPQAAVPQPQYMPTATIKDLMLSMVDPSADGVWLSVTSVVDEKGLRETRPQSDEDWKKVRQSAVALMEAANLLRAVSYTHLTLP